MPERGTSDLDDLVPRRRDILGATSGEDQEKDPGFGGVR